MDQIAIDVLDYGDTNKLSGQITRTPRPFHLTWYEYSTIFIEPTAFPFFEAGSKVIRFAATIDHSLQFFRHFDVGMAMIVFPSGKKKT